VEKTGKTGPQMVLNDSCRESQCDVLQRTKAEGWPFSWFWMAVTTVRCHLTPFEAVLWFEYECPTHAHVLGAGLPADGLLGHDWILRAVT
jgi:hypothetical protein